MLVQKKIIGEGAERYLPFALSKLRYLAGRWDGSPVSHVIRADDAQILLEVNARDRGAVTIVAAGLAYEFFTSNSQAGNPTNVDGSFTEGRAKRAITSTTLARPGADAPDWVVNQMPQRLLTHLTVNRQRNPEYTWFGDTRIMQSTLGAQSAGNTFDGRRAFRGLFTNVSGHREEVDAYFTYDVGFDVAPTAYGDAFTLPLLPLTKAPLWWRRAAIKRAGGRSFVIATDAHSNFYAYPLKQDGEGTTRLNGGYAVPASGYKKVAAASFLPAQAAVPTVNSMRPVPSAIQYARAGGGVILLQFTVIDQAYTPPFFDYSAFPGEEAGWARTNLLQDNHYVWAFNSDCSRAAAVVNTNEVPRYVTETSTNPTTGEAETRTIPFKHLKNYSPSVRVPYWTETLKGTEVTGLGGLREMSACRRAVVEVDLQLAVTGAGDMDFTFTVTRRQVLEDQCFMDADYAFGDARLQALGVQKDDLLLATVKRYMSKAGGWIAGTDGDNGVGIGSRVFLHVQKADGSPVKAWQLGAYSEQFIVDQKAADLAFGNFGTTHIPYGRYLDYGIDFTLAYKDTQINSQSARVSVLAFDLRSVSAILECETYASPGSYSDQATQYGVNTALAGYFFGAKEADAFPALTAHLDAAPPADAVMPFAYKTAPGAYATDDQCIWLDLYRIDVDYMLGELQNAYAIASHPKGHAAAAVVRSTSTTQQALDVILRRVGDENRSSTHLAAFNAAWAQARTYADYAVGGSFYPGRLQGYALWRTVQPKKVTGFSYE